MRSLACFAFLCSVAFSGATPAAPAPAQVQQKRFEAGKAALERLRRDTRRRKHRDAWEDVERDLDGALRAAPASGLAPEVALWAARARAELYEASRSPADVRTAVLAYRKVDEAYPDAPQGLQALTSALRLGARAHEHAETLAAARRLCLRYPRAAEAKAALALVPLPKVVPAPAGKPQRPVAVEDEAEEEDEDSGAEAAAPPSAASSPPALSQRVASKRGASQPAASQSGASQPAAESPSGDVDVPREAVNVIEEMVQEARGARPGPVAGLPGASSSAPAAALAARPASVAATPAAPRAQAEALPEPEAPEDPPQRTLALVKMAKDAVAKLTGPEDEPDAADKARELRTTALAGGTSLAAQLGLKIRRVVIDPGHGGKDTGAIGPHGLREKDVALSIARRLAARLRVLGFTVVLTRKDDRFIALDERTRIANEARADLFVSIHCNAARKRTLSGIETWTLNVASDRYAARLSAFENAEDERTVSDLRLILADLATKANAGDARELAQSVQSALIRGLRSRIGKVNDHGVKQALFYVLLGTHMPSILVETAFLSNPAEEARLRSTKYQDGAAEAIARGVKEFVDGRQRLALAP